jgi:hypothetical protein
VLSGGKPQGHDIVGGLHNGVESVLENGGVNPGDDALIDLGQCVFHLLDLIDEGAINVI